MNITKSEIALVGVAVATAATIGGINHAEARGRGLSTPDGHAVHYGAHSVAGPFDLPQQATRSATSLAHTTHKTYAVVAQAESLARPAQFVIKEISAGTADAIEAQGLVTAGSAHSSIEAIARDDRTLVKRGDTARGNAWLTTFARAGS